MPGEGPLEPTDAGEPVRVLPLGVQDLRGDRRLSDMRVPYYRSRVFYDAEVRLIRVILQDPASLDEVAGRVRSDHFGDPNLGELYAAALALRDRSEPLDYDAVAREVIRRGRLPENVTYTLLAACLDQPPNGANPDWLAERVLEGAAARRLYTAGVHIVGLAETPPDGDVGRAWGEAERLVLDAADGRAEEGVTGLRTALNEWADDLDERTRPGSRAAGIGTGLHELDDVLAGLRPRQLVLVGARPGVGKTLFALHLTRAAATAEYGVLYFSFEMGRIELTERMAVAVAGLNGHRLRQSRITPEEARRLAAAKAAADWPVTWVDRPGVRINQVASIARRHCRRAGCRLIVLDYLQLVPADGSHQKRYEQVGELSRRLKLLADELQVPVVALSQLNRAVNDRADRRPRLSDLRESGNLEQDADVVLLLHRPEATPRPDEPLEIIVAKQRAGPSGVTCRAALDPATGRIAAENIERAYGGRELAQARKVIGWFAAEVDENERWVRDAEAQLASKVVVPVEVCGTGTYHLDGRERVFLHVPEGSAEKLPWGRDQWELITLCVTRRYQALARVRSGPPADAEVVGDLVDEEGAAVSLAHILHACKIGADQPLELVVNGWNSLLLPCSTGTSRSDS